ncbi:hypothetical protein NPIL_175531 [Nephila pilipes]|uniref:Uncharacterized protein n=1 Tax=Nephila pilipes TaxID=299642 RepID=A0A8X6MMX2_NEPPI|nr:hypothetical protein NPIL_175531 [Nephila pilipes]
MKSKTTSSSFNTEAIEDRRGRSPLASIEHWILNGINLDRVVSASPSKVQGTQRHSKLFRWGPPSGGNGDLLQKAGQQLRFRKPQHARKSTTNI